MRATALAPQVCEQRGAEVEGLVADGGHHRRELPDTANLARSASLVVGLVAQLPQGSGQLPQGSAQPPFRHASRPLRRRPHRSQQSPQLRGQLPS